MQLLHPVGHALAIAGSMTGEVLWALILGFTLSAKARRGRPAAAVPRVGRGAPPRRAGRGESSTVDLPVGTYDR